MADPRPELTTTEARQGDRHSTNKRVLIIGIILVVIGFALAFLWNTMTTPDTDTTLQPGTAIEDVPPEAVEPEVLPEEPGTPAAADPTVGEPAVAPAQ